MASPILWRLDDVSVCCWHRVDDGISGLLHILRSKITRTCWTGFVDLCKWISGTCWEVDFWRVRLQISLSAGFWQIIGCGILGGGHKTQRPEISGGSKAAIICAHVPDGRMSSSITAIMIFHFGILFRLSAVVLYKRALNVWARYLVEQQPSL